MRRHPATVAVLLTLLASLAGGLYLASVRPIDGDEGYYASAAALVGQGETPYLDFFYPQSPLLPYLYLPASAVAGASLAGVRVYSVLLAVGALLPWGLFLARRRGLSRSLLWAGLLLVALDPGMWTWNVTVKTYALSNLGVLTAVWALDRGLGGQRVRCLAIAGAAAGLVVGVRLLYAPWAALLGLVLAWRALGPGATALRRRQLGAFAAGLAAGLLPTLAFLLIDPDRFLFNNLGYHLLRHRPLHEDGATGLTRIVAALAGFGRAIAHDPLLGLQLVLAGVGLSRFRRTTLPLPDGLPLLLGGGLLVHLVASLTPQPVHEQYFTGTLVALAAPLAVVGLGRLTAGLGRATVPAALAPVILLAGLGAVTMRAETSNREVWTFDSLEEVGAAIALRTAPGDTVMALWPGYPLEADRPWLPGLENHFGLEVSERLTRQERKRYHIAGYEAILDVLTHRRVKVLVLGAWMNGINSGIPQERLAVLFEKLNENYRVVEQIGEVKIARPRPQPAGSGRSEAPPALPPR